MSQTSFVNLEIRILKREGKGYPVELTVDGGQQFQGGYLKADILPWISTASPTDDGEQLFNWLFRHQRLQRAWAQIRGQCPQRRIRLRIDAAAPELHLIPWELLRDAVSDHIPQTLAAASATPFSRYLAGHWQPGKPVTDRPLKLVVAMANPENLKDYGLPKIEVEREKEIIQEALGELGSDQLELTFLHEVVTLSELENALKRGCHLLHVIAHGNYSRRKNRASLYLADDDNEVRLIKDPEFAEMIKRQSVPPQLVFLASCQSATRSPADAFRGFAPALIAAGVPAVLAMQDLIPMATAQAFTRTFYGQLLQHGQVDLAANEARSALLTAELPGGSVPVLFSRLPDNRLFAEASEREVFRPDVPPPPRPSRPPETDWFVGREAELAYYADKLATIHVTVISGMAGVGKTTLAAEMVRQVAAADNIFWHSFHEGEGFQAITWRLAGFLAWHGQDELWQMLQRARLTGGKPPPAETLFDYLFEMIRGQNFLLCFDDFHFVDDDPLINHLVEQLGEAVSAGELSFVLTTRRMPEFAQRLEFAELEGLNVSETQHWLDLRGLSLPGELVTRLHVQTEGNAEFLTLAIEALQQTQDPAHLIDRLAETDNLEGYLMREVDAGLSGGEQAVMSAVAVLLGRFGGRDAIEAILNGRNVRRPLRSLRERHLLLVQEGETDREYGQHAIVQSFYYDMPGRRQRRDMHRRAGEYYEIEEPDLLKASLHYERAEEYERAAQLATANVWLLINQGQAQALRNLLERFKADPLEPEQWARVNIARGQVYTLLEERQPARDSYLEALSQLAALPDSPAVREVEARACRGMGELLEEGVPQEALDWLQRGLAQLAGGNNLEEAALYINMGAIQMNLGNYVDALSTLERGLDRLPEGPSQLRSTALMNLGAVYSCQGDSERGKAYALRALEISRQLYEHFPITSILNNLGIDKYITGDWPGAIADFQQGLTLAERLGSEKLSAHLEVNLGAAYINTGDNETALNHLENSLNLAHKNNDRLTEIIAQFRLADLRIRLGEWEMAAVHLQEAGRLALELEAKGNLPEIYGAWAEVKLATKQGQAALDYAEKSVDLARELGESLELGMSLRVLGQVLFATSQYQPALVAFEQSLSLLADQDPYEAARTKVQWGLALLAGADLDQGTSLLQQARSTFQKLGARRDLAALEEILQS